MKFSTAAASLVLLVASGVEAFAPSSSRGLMATRTTTTTNYGPNNSSSQHQNRDGTALFSEDSKKKKTGGLDGNLRSKLVSESIAPWRAIRLFLYFALGSGAFIGGLINGSGAIAGSANPDFNLNTELLNIGIDFGAVAVFSVLAKFDLDKQAELEGKVEEKIERKKELKKVQKSIKEREKILSKLPLEIAISTDGQTRTSTVGELQSGARQHMIIVAGPKKACKDALIGANLLKMDFAMNNVLVVPYETDVTQADLQSKPSGGFGDRPTYETQPYIARPIGDEWTSYIKEELNDAVKQSGDNAKTEGIAIVVANDGQVIRRGVGTVPWRQMVEQLEEAVNPTPQSRGWLLE